MRSKKQKLITAILLVFTINTSLAVTGGPSLPKAEVACDTVLKKCAETVESQKKALKEKEDVIVVQDELIKEQEKEVERAHEQVNTAVFGGVSVSTLLLLLLIL